MNEFTTTVENERANLELAKQVHALATEVRAARLSVGMDVPDMADTTFKTDVADYFATVADAARHAQTTLLAKLKADSEAKQRNINATQEIIANLRAIQAAMPEIESRIAAIDNIQASSHDELAVVEKAKATTALAQIAETIATLEEKVLASQAALDIETRAIAQLDISQTTSTPSQAVADYQRAKQQTSGIAAKLKLIDSQNEQGKYRAVCDDLSLLAGRMQQLVGTEGPALAISANRGATENLAEVVRWVKSAEDTYVQQALQDAGILAHESKYSSQLPAARSKQPPMIETDISQFNDNELQSSIEQAIAAHKAWQLVHKTQEAIIHLRQQGNFAPNIEVEQNKEEINSHVHSATAALQALKQEFQTRKIDWARLTAENAADTEQFSKRIAFLKLEARLLQRLGESSDTIAEQMQALKESYLSAVQQRVTELTTRVAELAPQVPAEIEDTLQAKAQEIAKLNEASRKVWQALVELRLLAKAYGAKTDTSSSLDSDSSDGELAEGDIKFATGEKLILGALETLQARAKELFAAFDTSAKQQTSGIVPTDDKVTRAKATLSDWVSSLVPAKAPAFESIAEASAAIREYTHAALTSSSSASMRELLSTTREFDQARVTAITDRYELAVAGLAQTDAFANKQLAQQASLLAEVQGLLDEARMLDPQDLFSAQGEHSLVQALAKLEAATTILDEQKSLHDERVAMSEILATRSRSYWQALSTHDAEVLETISLGRETVAKQMQAILTIAGNRLAEQQRTRLGNHTRFVDDFNRVNTHIDEIKATTATAVTELTAAVPVVRTQGDVVTDIQTQLVVPDDLDNLQDEIQEMIGVIEGSLAQAAKTGNVADMSNACLAVGRAIKQMQEDSTDEATRLHQHQIQAFAAEHKVATELAIMAQAVYLSSLASQTHAELAGSRDFIAEVTAIANGEETDVGKALALQTFVTTIVEEAVAKGDGEPFAASMRPQYLNHIATQIDRELPLMPIVKASLLDKVASEQEGIGSRTAAIATRAKAEAYYQASRATQAYKEALERFALLKSALEENPIMQPLLTGFEQEVNSLHLQDPNNVMRMTGLTMALTALCNLHEGHITIDQFSAIVAELDGHADAGVRNLGKGLLLVGAGAALTLGLAGTGIGATVAAAVALYGLAKWLRGQEHGVAFLTRKIAMQQHDIDLSSIDEHKALLANWLALTTAKAKTFGNQTTEYSSEKTRLLGEKAEAVTVLAMTAIGNKYAAARVAAEPSLTRAAEGFADFKHSTGEKWQAFTTNVSHRWGACRASVREMPGRVGDSMSNAASRVREIDLRPDFAALGEGLRDRTTRAGESLNAGWQRTCHAMGELSQEMAEKFARMRFQLSSGNRALEMTEVLDFGDVENLHNTTVTLGEPQRTASFVI